MPETGGGGDDKDALGVRGEAGEGRRGSESEGEEETQGGFR